MQIEKVAYLLFKAIKLMSENLKWRVRSRKRYLGVMCSAVALYICVLHSLLYSATRQRPPRHTESCLLTCWCSLPGRFHGIYFSACLFYFAGSSASWGFFLPIFLLGCWTASVSAEIQFAVAFVWMMFQLGFGCWFKGQPQQVWNLSSYFH